MRGDRLMPPTAHRRLSRDVAWGGPPTLIGLALVALGLGLIVACAIAPDPGGPAGPRATTPQRGPEAERTLAERGDAGAQYALGLAYLTGEGLPRDPRDAARWLRRAAEQGHPGAATDLGVLLMRGYGVPRDDAKAVQWFRRAAGQGHAAGANNLGVMLMNGRGIVRDDAEAVRWFREAAEHGDGNAELNLGRMLKTGRGVPQDDAEAVRWFRRAAELEMADAENELAVMLWEGRGVPRDDAEAVRWLRQAAAKRNPLAQSNLAFALDAGRGVEPDHREAAHWYYLAARGGNHTAQNNLALLYENGRGLVRDVPEALRWYTEAAMGGEPAAQANVGRFYEAGLAVEPDPVRAFAWYALATSTQDFAPAIELRERLIPRLGDRLPEARQLAVTWQQEGGPQAPRPLPETPPATWHPATRLPLLTGDLISREALLVGHDPDRLRLSPDGQRLAYLAPWRGVMNVWVRTLGQHDDHVLTADGERDIEWFGRATASTCCIVRTPRATSAGTSTRPTWRRGGAT